MSNRVCRWGILSAAHIARKNWLAIKNSENAIITAVASRSVEKAQQFIDECQAHSSFETKPVALGSYEELLKRPDVDAVYLPIPTGLRKEWVIRAAEAGKHVLAEKPVGCDASEVAEMIAACKKHNVQFMDGVMFMHSLRLNKLRETLNDGQSVGQLRRITSQFSFNGTEEFCTLGHELSDAAASQRTNVDGSSSSRQSVRSADGVFGGIVFCRWRFVELLLFIPD